MFNPAEQPPEAGDASPLVWSDCAGLCWNLAAPGLGEAPHADSHSTGRSSASLGSFPRPGAQWLHKADYKLQRIPEGARSDAGANEPREPLSPDRREGRAGKRKAWTTQSRGRPACLPPLLSAGIQKAPQRTERPWERAQQEVCAGGQFAWQAGKERPPLTAGNCLFSRQQSPSQSLIWKPAVALIVRYSSR
uniref:Uncharacterized protein n=1 Tax=Naja naja TaxID=35670 RepID=A0A8C6YHS3_NAJNA